MCRAVHVAVLCFLSTQCGLGKRVFKQLGTRTKTHKRSLPVALKSFESAHTERNTSEEITQGCEYNKKDVDYGDASSDLGEYDPRATGFGPRLRQLGRTLIEHRYIALELPGEEAKSLTLALYGIIVSAVPFRCYQPLIDALAGVHMLVMEQQAYNEEREHWLWSNMDKIKAAKEVLLAVLEDLPNACSRYPSLGHEFSAEEQESQIEIGKAAQVRLKYLRWGYWGPHMLPQDTQSTPNAPQVVARVFDEKRMKEGNLKLRQIFFYARMHLLMSTEVTLRKRMVEMTNNGRMDDFHKTRDMMKDVLKLENMRNARLEFIEYSGTKKCEPALENEVNNLLDVLSTESGSFRAVLMFRERYWQASKHAWGNFFKHPIMSIRKWGSRFANEWKGGTNGHCFGMIIKRVLRVANIAGIAFGVATLGGSTMTAAIVNAIFAETSFLVQLLGTNADKASGFMPLLQFLITKIAGAPVNKGTADRVLQDAEAWTPIQKILVAIDEDDRFKDEFRAKMDEKQREIMESKDIKKLMDDLKTPEDDTDVPPEVVKDEVHRYVQSMVLEGFVNEAVPVIAEVVRQRQMEMDPSYGWYPWITWFTVTNQGNSMALLRKNISYTDPVGKDSMKGYVEEIQGKGLTGHWSGRLMKVRTPSKTGHYYGKLRDLRLTDEVKENLMVRDIKVFKQMHAEWLTWLDWKTYRGATDATGLKGKAIRVDVTNYKCDASQLLNKDAIHTDDDHYQNLENFGATGKSCLHHIAEAEGVVFVKETHWKMLGIGSRQIDVQIGTQIVCNFLLTSIVKPCLKIQDPDTYEKFRKDTPRRLQAQKWVDGELDTKVGDGKDISVEEAFSIDRQTRCDPSSSPRNAYEQAKTGNLALESKIGFKSEELSVQEDDLSDESVNDAASGHPNVQELSDEPSVMDVVKAAVECDDPKTCCS